MTVQDFEGTRVDEISDGIFRISTRSPVLQAAVSPTTSTCLSMTSRCSFTPESGACFHRCRRP
jgi:hypothetical protein